MPFNKFFMNTIFYSFEFVRFSKIQNTLNYSNDFFHTKITHTYEKTPVVDTNFITFSLDTDYYRNYNIFASLNYDLKSSFFKPWKIGFKKKKKCWDYSIVYSENITPQLTSSTNNSINKKGIYLLFNLYPIGSIDYTFTKENNVGSGGAL